jgi:hypothetical protein
VTDRDVPGAEQTLPVNEQEERLARARLAFDAGLREASETGARAARRLLVPALWGAALVGGTLLAFAVLRLMRRPRTAPALLHVTIAPRLESRPLLPAFGATVARLAMQRLLAAPVSGGLGAHLASTAPAATAFGAAASHRNGSSNGSPGNGRAKA